MNNPTLTVSVLRELFRNLRDFRVLWESQEIDDVITGSDGTSYNLFDIEYLYEQSQTGRLISPRQALAIRLFLFENMTEGTAAEAMGVSRTNPVGMYATLGLERIVTLVHEDFFPRFRAHDAEMRV